MVFRLAFVCLIELKIGINMEYGFSGMELFGK